MGAGSLDGGVAWRCYAMCYASGRLGFGLNEMCSLSCDGLTLISLTLPLPYTISFPIPKLNLTWVSPATIISNRKPNLEPPLSCPSHPLSALIWLGTFLSCPSPSLSALLRRNARENWRKSCWRILRLKRSAKQQIKAPPLVNYLVNYCGGL